MFAQLTRLEFNTAGIGAIISSKTRGAFSLKNSMWKSQLWIRPIVNSRMPHSGRFDSDNTQKIFDWNMKNSQYCDKCVSGRPTCFCKKKDTIIKTT